MALTKLPTKTDGETVGEIGRVVIDRPRPFEADPRYDIVAAKHERLKDQVIANATAIGVESAPAAGSLEAKLLTAGAFQLVFEWNGIDTSQFDIANHWTDDDASNGRITGMGMSVAANVRGVKGNELVIEPTGYSGGGDGGGLILALGTVPDAGRLIIEAEVWDHDTNGFGFCVANDPGATPQADLFAFCQCFVQITTNWHIEDGEGKGGGGPPTYGAIGAPPMLQNAHAILTVSWGLRNDAGDIPRGSFKATTQGQAIAPGGTLGNVGGYADAPPSSEWNDQALTRWGVCQYAGGSQFAGPTRLLSLRVYSY